MAETSGLAFSEETITESVLLDLQTSHPNHVKIKAFTKPQEKINGADWEWWIGEPGSWLGMRVQAKRIKLPSETFASLQSYGIVKGKGTSQIDNLIARAQFDQLNAAYCLYTVTRKLPMLRTWPTYTVTGGGPISPQGCLIADAHAVKAIGKNRLADLAQVCIPWHLLVCHCSSGMIHPRSIGWATYNLLRASQAQAQLDGRDGLGAVVEPKESLPDHMSLMREEAGDGSYLAEYAQQRGLKGLVLINGAMERA